MRKSFVRARRLAGALSAALILALCASTAGAEPGSGFFSAASSMWRLFDYDLLNIFLTLSIVALLMAAILNRRRRSELLAACMALSIVMHFISFAMLSLARVRDLDKKSATIIWPELRRVEVGSPLLAESAMSRSMRLEFPAMEARDLHDTVEGEKSKLDRPLPEAFEKASADLPAEDKPNESVAPSASIPEPRQKMDEALNLAEFKPDEPAALILKAASLPTVPEPESDDSRRSDPDTFTALTPAAAALREPASLNAPSPALKDSVQTPAAAEIKTADAPQQQVKLEDELRQIARPTMDRAPVPSAELKTAIETTEFAEREGQLPTAAELNLEKPLRSEPSEPKQHALPVARQPAGQAVESGSLSVQVPSLSKLAETPVEERMAAVDTAEVLQLRLDRRRLPELQREKPGAEPAVSIQPSEFDASVPTKTSRIPELSGSKPTAHLAGDSEVEPARYDASRDARAELEARDLGISGEQLAELSELEASLKTGAEPVSEMKVMKGASVRAEPSGADFAPSEIEISKQSAVVAEARPIEEYFSMKSPQLSQSSVSSGNQLMARPANETRQRGASDGLREFSGAAAQRQRSVPKEGSGFSPAVQARPAAASAPSAEVRPIVQAAAALDYDRARGRLVAEPDFKLPSAVLASSDAPAPAGSFVPRDQALDVGRDLNLPVEQVASGSALSPSDAGGPSFARLEPARSAGRGGEEPSALTPVPVALVVGKLAGSTESRASKNRPALSPAAVGRQELQAVALISSEDLTPADWSAAKQEVVGDLSAVQFSAGDINVSELRPAARRLEQPSRQNPEAELGPNVRTMNVAKAAGLKLSEFDQRAVAALESGPVVPSATGEPVPVRLGAQPVPETARAAVDSDILVASPQPIQKSFLPLSTAPDPKSVPEKGIYKMRKPEKRRLFIRELGGTPETEEAMERALEWLSGNQSDDGRWDVDGFKSLAECGGAGDLAGEDVAVSGMALLSFLGAGYTHLEGDYSETVRKGIEWLLNCEDESGDFRGTGQMYGQAIATVVLCEAYSLTDDKRLLSSAQRAVKFIVDAQTPGSGWRYGPMDSSDTSVTGWQILALKSAKIAGIAVPEQTFKWTEQWLDQVRKGKEGGLYAFKPAHPVTPVMTAEGLFCQLFMNEQSRAKGQDESIAYIMENLPRWDPNGNSVHMYYWYYATLSLYMAGAEEFDPWNTALTQALLQGQRSSGPAAGSWDPVCEIGPRGGRIYSTSIGALCLQVYYRFLPLYKQTGN